MTFEKIQQALRELDEMISVTNGDIEPFRLSGEASYPEEDLALGHCRALIAEALTWDESRKEKAFRWLGFIQGVMWMTGWSIDDMKHVNMPDAPAA